MGNGTIVIQPMIGKSEPSKPTLLNPHTASLPETDHVDNETTYTQSMPTRAPMAVIIADKIINGTTGSLNIDIIRPQLPDAQNRTSLFTFKEPVLHIPPQERGLWNLLTGQQPRRRRKPRLTPAQIEQQRQNFDYDNLPNTAFNTSGTRLKALRHISFGPEKQYTKHGRTFTSPMFDFGAGLEFRLDTAELHPQARLKINNMFSLKILPAPTLKIQKRFQIPGLNTSVGIKVSYECPIGPELQRFYAPPARLFITMDNAVENGVRLTQSGVEFAANTWLLNGNARLRASGILQLPSEVPFNEDEMFVRFEPRHLGIKAKW